MSEELNIPEYRAKKKDSDDYIEGTGLTNFLNVYPEEKNKNWLWSDYWWKEIDTSTLSIHFPDMIDSEGKKIFASLSADGKGGSILECEEVPNRPSGSFTFITKFKDMNVCIECLQHEHTNWWLGSKHIINTKVIGIKE